MAWINVWITFMYSPLKLLILAVGSNDYTPMIFSYPYFCFLFESANVLFEKKSFLSINLCLSCSMSYVYSVAYVRLVIYWKWMLNKSKKLFQASKLQTEYNNWIKNNSVLTIKPTRSSIHNGIINCNLTINLQRRPLIGLNIVKLVFFYDKCNIITDAETKLTFICESISFVHFDLLFALFVWKIIEVIIARMYSSIPL